jgi:uncharacterized protein (TIGR00251 family)
MSRRVIELHVQPGARSTGFAGMHGERVKLRLAAPAVDNKANRALVEFLAEAFGVPRRNVTIEAGLASRLKTVSITGAVRTPQDFPQGN